MMRGTPRMRLALGILSPAFLALCLWAIRAEDARPWMSYQEEFRKLYVARVTAKRQDAERRGDATETARWQRVSDEVSHQLPEIGQIYLEDLQVADRCTTCHAGIDNPLFRDAPQPFRAHPGGMLADHEVNRFGCTPCHGGQGMATSVESAHGKEANWPSPMLPPAFLQSSCARCHEVTHGLHGAEVVSRGGNLFLRKGCYGCHDTKGVSYLPKFAPPLTPIRSKLVNATDWMFAWIKDPTAFNPETAMPRFVLTDEEVGKITTFLLTMPAPAAAGRVVLDGASATEGERLFMERGCRGCHGVKADEKSISPRVPHLAGIGSKVTAEWLDRWIADPQEYNPDTAMPKLVLKDDERRAIVAYLLTLKRDQALAPAPDLNRFKAAEGKLLVRQYECYGCHAIEGFERMRPSVPDLREFARKPVDELDFGTTRGIPRTKWDWLRGKLKQPRGYETEKIKLKMPQYRLGEEEMRAVITRVLAFDTPVWPARYLVRASAAQRSRRELSWMLAHFNCNGCHALNEKDPRLASFLKRENALPPTLDGAGSRLRRQYIYDFVLDPKPLRAWLGMRMPRFNLDPKRAQVMADGFVGAAGINNPYAEVASLNIVGPPLTKLGTKIADPDWLVAWLRKPSLLRPGSAMPDLDLKPEEVQAIIRYLLAESAAAPNGGRWQGGDRSRGKRLFVSKGCRGCHAVERKERSISARVPNLAGVGMKVTGEWLAAWITSPRKYSPQTPMPELTLTDGERRDLIAYLLSLREGADVLAEAPRFSPGGDPAAGRDVIDRYACARCHEIRGFPAPAPALMLARAGDSAGTNIALRNGRLLVEHYNCRGCHKIEKEGGAITDYLERKTLAPPLLDGEGARVQHSWLAKFLRKPTNLRPWLELRMPNYSMTEVEADALARYFAALAEVVPEDEPVPEVADELAQRGLRRFVHFKCGQCHPTSIDKGLPEDVDPEDLSINLMLVKERLRPSWIHGFLARPKAVAGTQTRMPTVFYTIDGIPKVEHPDKDIDAIAAYMLSMQEPPERAMARLDREREQEQKKQRKDWSTFEY